MSAVEKECLALLVEAYALWLLRNPDPASREQWLTLLVNRWQGYLW